MRRVLLLPPKERECDSVSSNLRATAVQTVPCNRVGVTMKIRDGDYSEKCKDHRSKTQHNRPIRTHR